MPKMELNPGSHRTKQGLNLHFLAVDIVWVGIIERFWFGDEASSGGFDECVVGIIIFYIIFCGSLPIASVGSRLVVKAI